MLEPGQHPTPVGRVTDGERALERKLEGPLTCPNVAQSQERQVPRSCQEGAGSHDILLLRGAGRQADPAGDLVSWNLAALLRGACLTLLHCGSRVWLGQVTEGKPL